MRYPFNKYVLRWKVGKRAWETIQKSRDFGDLEARKEKLVSYYISLDYSVLAQNSRTITLSNGSQDIKIGIYDL